MVSGSFSRLIHRLKTIPVSSPYLVFFFVENKKLVLKFIWNCKGPGVAKNSYKKEESIYSRPPIFFIFCVCRVCSYMRFVCEGTCMWKPRVDAKSLPSSLSPLLGEERTFSWTQSSLVWPVEVASGLRDPIWTFRAAMHT